jgi:hypothetical protein
VANKMVRHPDLGNLYTPGAMVLEKEPQHVIERACPYGQPGDRLWVREAWSPTNPISYGMLYRADFDTPSVGRWKPSIHMPRWASRITLEVTEVRVERLQDISEVDALAEGIVQLGDGGYGLPAGEHYHAADPRQSYFSLWEEINGPGSVESDPWVWAVSFKVVKGGGL